MVTNNEAETYVCSVPKAQTQHRVSLTNKFTFILIKTEHLVTFPLFCQRIK